jgi:hypothetical protein
MNRFLLTSSLLALAGMALAQGAFTIRRPVEGAKVRETVQIRIPVDSVPQGVGYVGFWVNGRFLEAVAPTSQNISGRDFVYELNTKDRKIPDGRMTVEAVLYAADSRFTRRLNKTQVTVTLDNSASIKIPADGLKLRYKMIPNTEFTYSIKTLTTYSNLTQEQFLLDPDLTQLQQDGESLRYRYVWMNREQTRNGLEGLVMAQPLTEKGKDYAFLTTSGSEGPKKYYDYHMSPIYFRLTSTGRELWGSSPFFTPSEGSIGEPSNFNLYGNFPLPILPTGGIKPNGIAWPGTIASGVLDLAKLYTQDKFTTVNPGRGVLLGIEFERGRPCARYRIELAQGNDLVGIQSLRQDVWFALDLGMPIRVESRSTSRVRVAEQIGGGAGGRAGAGGGQNGGDGGAPAGPTAGGRESRFMRPEVLPDDQNRMFGPSFLDRSQVEPYLVRQNEGAGSPESGGGRVGGGRPGGGQRPGGGGGNPGGGGRTRNRIVTQSQAFIMIME